MSQNAWDEITTKLNEMAEENMLIKQAVHKIHNTATGAIGKAKNKTLVANPDDRVNNRKQATQGSKGIRFSLRDHDSKSPTTPSKKVKPTKPISKANNKTTIDDQQSFTMISEVHLIKMQSWTSCAQTEMRRIVCSAQNDYTT